MYYEGLSRVVVAGCRYEPEALVASGCLTLSVVRERVREERAAADWARPAGGSRKVS